MLLELWTKYDIQKSNYQCKFINKYSRRFYSSTLIKFHKDNNNMDHKVVEANIVIDKRPFTKVSEGLANIDFPSSLDVFYNPVQEFNRDMSVAVLRLHASDINVIQKTKLSSKTNDSDLTWKSKMSEEDFNMVASNTDILPHGVKNENGITLLEALAASGLRSIRYAKEVGGIKEIIANDISKQAVECMKNNLNSNSVEHIVTPSQNDASLVMYQNREFKKRFTAIDLDPYGSPHIFLDGAVQSIADGGLLLVTCTDMAVLCGNSPETCYLKYGALSIKHNACHEMALRIILQSIEANANKYGRYIVPLLSVSVDFYCRVFVRVFTSQLRCKETFTKLSWVNVCSSCESTTFQPLGRIIRNGTSVKYQVGTLSGGPSCPHCGGTYRTAGPIWTAPIHDPNFVSRLKTSLTNALPLTTHRRLEGILTMVEEELPHPPLYIIYDKILKVLRMSCFKMKEFSSAILNAGYKVSPTHAARNGLKTDAPYSVIWDILREKAKTLLKSADNKDKFPIGHPARTILRLDETESSSPSPSPSGVTVTPEGDVTPVSFEMHPSATFESVKAGVLRYQQNPTDFFGPKSRSVTSLFHGDLQKKSRERQGNRTKSKRPKLDEVPDEGDIEKQRKENDEPA